MSRAGGRVMALDLGDARIGVALSDPMGVIAQPLQVIERRGDRQAAREVRALVAEHEVGTIVVGLPRELSGDEGERSGQARSFAERLRASLHGVAVEMWDERLSTVEAERAMIAGGARRRRRREKIDAVAAAVILQAFLDSRAPSR